MRRWPDLVTATASTAYELVTRGYVTGSVPFWSKLTKNKKKNTAIMHISKAPCIILSSVCYTCVGMLVQVTQAKVFVQPGGGEKYLQVI